MYLENFEKTRNFINNCCNHRPSANAKRARFDFFFANLLTELRFLLIFAPRKLKHKLLWQKQWTNSPK